MQNVYTVLVRKDASTILPVQVPEYEIPLLEVLYGEENLLNADLKLGGEYGYGEAVGQIDPSEDEHGRLEAKYGGNEQGAIVEQVYGKKSLKALAKLIAKEADEPAKKSGKKSAE